MKMIKHLFASLLVGLTFFSSAVMAAEPLAKVLAGQPIAWVQGNQCHVRGAVWMYGPLAGVPVELLDGTRVWRATTDANGIYALSLPYSGRDFALIERPAQLVVHTRTPTPVHVAKPSLLCSRALTARLFPQPQRSN